MKFRFQSARYHRNGMSGEPFYAVRFRFGRDELGAIVFDEPGHVAILDDNGDSWRPEDFEDALRCFLASPAGQRMLWPGLIPANDVA